MLKWWAEARVIQTLAHIVSPHRSIASKMWDIPIYGVAYVVGLSVYWSQPWVLQKRMNRSIRCLGCGLAAAHETMSYRWGPGFSHGKGHLEHVTDTHFGNGRVQSSCPPDATNRMYQWRHGVAVPAVATITVTRGGVVAQWWKSHLRWRGRDFKPRSGRGCVTTLGNLFTPMCLHADSLRYYTGVVKLQGTFTSPIHLSTTVTCFRSDLCCVTALNVRVR